MALFKVFRGKSTALDNVKKVDGHAYFCIDDGSFWIDYTDDNGTLNRKPIGRDQWTVAIENAVAALRAEFEEKLESKTDYLGVVSSADELSTIAGAGDYHRVQTDFAFGEETAHAGDLLIAVINLPAQTPECWDLVHVEDRVQSDYEQNNENAVDYIKNRPFYDYYAQGEEVFANTDSVLDGLNTNKVVAAIDGEKYSVTDIFNLTINGETYNNIPFRMEMEGEYGYGNIGMFSSNFENTGENYLVGINPSLNMVVVCVAEGARVEDFTLVRIGQVKIIKKIDEKFLPDNLATEEYVNNAVPTNYITTNTDQVGLSGVKIWDSGFELDPSNHLTFKTSPLEMTYGIDNIKYQYDSDNYQQNFQIDSNNGFSCAYKSVFSKDNILQLNYGELISQRSEGNGDLLHFFKINHTGISYKYTYMNEEHWSGSLLFPKESSEGTIATREWINNGEFEIREDVMLIFDGGGADVTLAVLDTTKLG